MDPVRKSSRVRMPSARVVENRQAKANAAQAQTSGVLPGLASQDVSSSGGAGSQRRKPQRKALGTSEAGSSGTLKGDAVAATKKAGARPMRLRPSTAKTVVNEEVDLAARSNASTVPSAQRSQRSSVSTKSASPTKAQRPPANPGMASSRQAEATGQAYYVEHDAVEGYMNGRAARTSQDSQAGPSRLPADLYPHEPGYRDQQPDLWPVLDDDQTGQSWRSSADPHLPTYPASRSFAYDPQHHPRHSYQPYEPPQTSFRPQRHHYGEAVYEGSLYPTNKHDATYDYPYMPSSRRGHPYISNAAPTRTHSRGEMDERYRRQELDTFLGDAHVGHQQTSRPLYEDSTYSSHGFGYVQHNYYPNGGALHSRPEQSAYTGRPAPPPPSAFPAYPAPPMRDHDQRVYSSNGVSQDPAPLYAYGYPAASSGRRFWRDSDPAPTRSTPPAHDMTASYSNGGRNPTAHARRISGHLSIADMVSPRNEDFSFSRRGTSPSPIHAHPPVDFGIGYGHLDTPPLPANFSAADGIAMLLNAAKASESPEKTPIEEAATQLDHSNGHFLPLRSTFPALSRDWKEERTSNERGFGSAQIGTREDASINIDPRSAEQYPRERRTHSSSPPGLVDAEASLHPVPPLERPLAPDFESQQCDTQQSDAEPPAYNACADQGPRNHGLQAESCHHTNFVTSEEPADVFHRAATSFAPEVPPVKVPPPASAQLDTGTEADEKHLGLPTTTEAVHAEGIPPSGGASPLVAQESSMPLAQGATLPTSDGADAVVTTVAEASDANDAAAANATDVPGETSLTANTLKTTNAASIGPEEGGRGSDAVVQSTTTSAPATTIEKPVTNMRPKRAATQRTTLPALPPVAAIERPTRKSARHSTALGIAAAKPAMEEKGSDTHNDQAAVDAGVHPSSGESLSTDLPQTIEATADVSNGQAIEDPTKQMLSVAAAPAVPDVPDNGNAQPITVEGVVTIPKLEVPEHPNEKARRPKKVSAPRSPRITRARQSAGETLPSLLPSPTKIDLPSRRMRASSDSSGLTSLRDSASPIPIEQGGVPTADGMALDAAPEPKAALHARASESELPFIAAPQLAGPLGRFYDFEPIIKVAPLPNGIPIEQHSNSHLLRGRKRKVDSVSASGQRLTSLLSSSVAAPTDTSKPAGQADRRPARIRRAAGGGTEGVRDLEDMIIEWLNRYGETEQAPPADLAITFSFCAEMEPAFGATDFQIAQRPAQSEPAQGNDIIEVPDVIPYDDAADDRWEAQQEVEVRRWTGAKEPGIKTHKRGRHGEIPADPAPDEQYLVMHRKFEMHERKQRSREKETLQHERYKMRTRVDLLQGMSEGGWETVLVTVMSRQPPSGTQQGHWERGKRALMRRGADWLRDILVKEGEELLERYDQLLPPEPRKLKADSRTPTPLPVHRSSSPGRSASPPRIRLQVSHPANGRSGVARDETSASPAPAPRRGRPPRTIAAVSTVPRASSLSGLSKRARDDELTPSPHKKYASGGKPKLAELRSLVASASAPDLQHPSTRRSKLAIETSRTDSSDESSPEPPRPQQIQPTSLQTRAEVKQPTESGRSTPVMLRIRVPPASSPSLVSAEPARTVDTVPPMGGMRSEARAEARIDSEPETTAVEAPPAIQVQAVKEPVASERPWVPSRSKSPQKSRNTPDAGRSLRGRINTPAKSAPRSKRSTRSQGEPKVEDLSDQSYEAQEVDAVL